MGEALQEARSLVGEYWPAIEAIARRLTRENFEISGDEVNDIVLGVALDLHSARHPFPNMPELQTAGDSRPPALEKALTFDRHKLVYQ